MQKPALVINSHSSNKHCLNLFFFCLEKYVEKSFFSKVYLFFDQDILVPDYVSLIKYNASDSYRDQMISCLKEVKEDIILYSNEDYLFYEKPRYDLAQKSLYRLANSEYSFIKFVHTDLEKYNEVDSCFFRIDENSRNTFSQTLSFWKTQDFLKIHLNCEQSEIGNKGDQFKHLEEVAKIVCADLKIRGLCYYNNEPKRGLCHFDTEVFPHVASALNRGQWNREYDKELKEIRAQYEDFAKSKS